MDFILSLLNTIWGRFIYILGQPIQGFNQWAFDHPAYYLLFPELFLVLAIVAILALWVFSKKENLNLMCWLAIGGSFANFLMTIHVMQMTSRYFSYGLGTFWGGLETIDPFSLFFKQLMDWGDIFLFLIMMGYPLMKKYQAEFIILMLMATVAFDLMVGSSDLLAIYVMTEFGSILLYIMAAYYKDNLRSLEGGLKLFITGVVSSAMMLFGIAGIYGICGSTNLYDLKAFLEIKGLVTTHPMVVIAFVMILVGIGYKLGVAPFHLWVPDTYEGAPTPVAAFIAAFPKVAGFAVFMRLFMLGFQPASSAWVPLVGAIAILTMFVGNIMALQQRSFKRLMGFSGVAQMGYVLMALIASTSYFNSTDNIGFYAALYYLLVYFLAALGAFYIQLINESYGGDDRLDSLNGFCKRSPWLAAFMTIFLLALAGIPPTMGFIAKFLVFAALIINLNPLNLVLVIAGVVNVVIAVYYYFDIIRRMYLLEPEPRVITAPMEAPERSSWRFMRPEHEIRPFLFLRLAVLFPAAFIFILGFLFVTVPYQYVAGAFFLTYYVTMA
jgi:NADH-quinone oxidoreductase subunit N